VLRFRNVFALWQLDCYDVETPVFAKSMLRDPGFETLASQLLKEREPNSEADATIKKLLSIYH